MSSILAEPGTYDEKSGLAMRELARVAEAAWVKVLVPDLAEGGLKTIVRLRPDGTSLPVAQSVQGLAITAYERG